MPEENPAATESTQCRTGSYLILSSLVWALVMVDTGQIAWPLAVWMATSLAPASQRLRPSSSSQRTNCGHNRSTATSTGQHSRYRNARPRLGNADR